MTTPTQPDPTSAAALLAALDAAVAGMLFADGLASEAECQRAAEQVQAAIARIRARHPEMETTTP